MTTARSRRRVHLIAPTVTIISGTNYWCRQLTLRRWHSQSISSNTYVLPVESESRASQPTVIHVKPISGARDNSQQPPPAHELLCSLQPASQPASPKRRRVTIAGLYAIQMQMHVCVCALKMACHFSVFDRCRPTDSVALISRHSWYDLECCGRAI